MKNRNHSSYVMMSISVVAMLVVITLAFVSGLVLAPSVNSEVQAAEIAQTPDEAQAAPQVQVAADVDDILAGYEQAFIALYRDALPGVVNIRVIKEFDAEALSRFGFGLPDPDGEEDEDNGDTPESEETPEIPEEFFFNQGGGSGFVWDNQGHIVTNHHVVAGATKIEVLFADDTIAEAELIGSEPDADLAVIKVDLPASTLEPMTLGHSDALQVGQLSVAIGNPFGQEFTMTSGIVSGVGRTIRSGNSQFSIPEVIQTDASINPGNSGGPLLNRQGEVIGINTQIISRSGSSSGVGFAVPIDIAKRVIPTLIEGDDFEYAWLGISGNNLTAEALAFRELDNTVRGAVVVSVIEDGPADEAGLQGRDESLDVESEAFRFGGDIITAINGEPVTDMNDLITYLVEETEPGDQVTLDVIRDDGAEESVTVTLGVRPSAEN